MMGSSPSPIEALKTYLQVEQFTQNSSRRFRLPKWPENLHVEFPGNPMVRTRYFQCHGGPGSIPLQGIKSQQAIQHDQKKKRENLHITRWDKKKRKNGSGMGPAPRGGSCVERKVPSPGKSPHQ